MAKKKYLKDGNGNTRALASNELELEKPLGNENYDIDVFNRNMDKIDNAIKNVKNDLSNMDLIVVTEDKNITRKEKTFYFVVTDKQSSTGSPVDEVKVSPNMGIKII